jgi:hypothetical protein
VAERHRCPNIDMRPVPLNQRGRDFDPQPARRIDADGLIAAGLARFAIGSHKHPRRIPTCPPLRLRHTHLDEMGAVTPQPFASHRDRGPARIQRLPRDGQSLTQDRQAPGFPKPLTSRPVTTPPRPASTRGDGFLLTGEQRTPLLQHRDRRPQIPDMGGQRTHAQLVLILHGPGERPSPPR